MKRALLVCLALVAVVAGSAVTYVSFGLPRQRPAPALQVEATPERLARGRYLVENVSNCVHCHSAVDTSHFGLPVKKGTEGAGGMCVGRELGLDGVLCVPNITPDVETGIGAWSDGELVRAIREGVGRHGQALFPMMPYGKYREMSDEDVQAVVAYLRTLPARKNAVQPRELPFPLSVIVRFMPRPVEGVVASPPAHDELARGRYLVALAGCDTCHTPVDAQHQPLEGRYLAGGQSFPLQGGGRVVSPNLTFHPTGLGNISRESFIALFKAHLGEPNAVPPQENTVMAWSTYAGLTEEDLGAIWAYLETAPHQDNRVLPWPEATATR